MGFQERAVNRFFQTVPTSSWESSPLPGVVSKLLLFVYDNSLSKLEAARAILVGMFGPRDC